jgi:hypothetical protein
LNRYDRRVGKAIVQDIAPEGKHLAARTFIVRELPPVVRVEWHLEMRWGGEPRLAVLDVALDEYNALPDTEV